MGGRLASQFCSRQTHLRSIQKRELYPYLDETFSEETDDWSGPKGEGEIYSEHDGGEDDEAGAEVVLHHVHRRLEHCDILRLHQPSSSPTLKSTHFVCLEAFSSSSSLMANFLVCLSFYL